MSPSRRAVVVRPPAAPEPTSGSVSPNAPIFSSRAIAGSHRCFCSSEPQSRTEAQASPPWTPWNVAIEQSTRASSMLTMPESRWDLPGNP